MENKLDLLIEHVHEIWTNQKLVSQQLKFSNGRLESMEKRQDEVVRLLAGIRSEMAGLSSGLARRDSLVMGGGLPNIRRDSPTADQLGRRDSLVLTNEGWSQGRSGSITLMEVEPWEPPQEVKLIIDRMLEHQFLLSPWVREKRLRNQLRLVLKDHVEAGPMRRSTVTKIVHDTHQIFPVWRNQIRETMFNNWDLVQEDVVKAAEVIFGQFKKPRFSDEFQSTLLYAEHMVEVGQFLRWKIVEKRRNSTHNGTQSQPINVTNSKFWYEVKKKINEVLEQQKNAGKETSTNDDEEETSDTEKANEKKSSKTKGMVKKVVTQQSSLETEDEDKVDEQLDVNELLNNEKKEKDKGDKENKAEAD